MPVQASTICEVHQFRELTQLKKWHVQQQQKNLNFQEPEKKKKSEKQNPNKQNKESRSGRRKKKEKYLNNPQLMNSNHY